jgi:hypothetical protein
MTAWTRSSHCPNNATCVEVRHTTACTDLGELHPDCENQSHAKTDVVAVRDSKDPGRQPLVFTLEEWAAFTAGVKAGEFDEATS